MDKTRPFSLEEHRCALHVVQCDPEPDLLVPTAWSICERKYESSFLRRENLKRFLFVQNSLLLHVFNRMSSFPDISRIQRIPNVDAQNDIFTFQEKAVYFLVEFSKPRNCVEIRDPKFFYSSPIFWFGLHSRCEHPMRT